jgi:acetolactate synthase-1/2/3 large subunit
MALHNLCRARVPVHADGRQGARSPRAASCGTRDTYCHFVQEPFDQASVVRPYTKWEYNLPSGVIAKESAAPRPHVDGERSQGTGLSRPSRARP